jgi:hypothetical protein
MALFGLPAAVQSQATAASGALMQQFVLGGGVPCSDCSSCINNRLFPAIACDTAAECACQVHNGSSAVY